MDRGTVLLQSFQQNLRPWVDRIKRATSASSVTFVPRTNGEFVVRVEWKTKDGETKVFERHYGRLEVFGSSYHNGPNGWRIQHKTCQYAKLLMREVLEARGV